MGKFCKNVSSRQTELFCRNYWNDAACCFFSGYDYPTDLSGFLFSYSSLLSEFLSITDSLSSFWCRGFLQVSTHTFCSWDDIFTQIGNFGFLNNLCKWTKSPSTLSSNTSIEWNLYSYWSNHPLAFFQLKMNVGGFPKRQSKVSDNNRYN